MSGKNKFKEAVVKTEDIKSCYWEGLKALKKNSAKVKVSDTRKLEGSVDIDTCTRARYPDANRWDYMLSYNGRLFFAEVHPAKSGEIEMLFNKLDWLIEWFNNKAPELKKLKEETNEPFYWIATKGVALLKTSPQYRKLSQKRIQIVSRLTLE